MKDLFDLLKRDAIELPANQGDEIVFGDLVCRSQLHLFTVDGFDLWSHAVCIAPSSGPSKSTAMFDPAWLDDMSAACTCSKREAGHIELEGGTRAVSETRKATASGDTGE